MSRDCHYRGQWCWFFVVADHLGVTVRQHVNGYVNRTRDPTLDGFLDVSQGRYVLQWDRLPIQPVVQDSLSEMTVQILQEPETVVRIRCCCHPSAHNWPIPLFSKSKRMPRTELLVWRPSQTSKGGFTDAASENVKSAVVRWGLTEAGVWPLKEKRNNTVDKPVSYLVLNHRLYVPDHIGFPLDCFAICRFNNLHIHGWLAHVHQWPRCRMAPFNHLIQRQINTVSPCLLGYFWSKSFLTRNLDGDQSGSIPRASEKCGHSHLLRDP